MICNIVAVGLAIAGVFLGEYDERFAWLILGAFSIYSFFFSMNLNPVSTGDGSYLFAWKSVTEQNHILDLNVVGEKSPPFLHLTDGGHFDNLGLYELLKRRCKKIVVFDGGYDPQVTCDDLVWALNQKEFRREAVYRAERYSKSKKKTKLISIDEAIDKFRASKESSHLVIHIHWTKENRETEIWYSKLRARDRDAEGDTVCCGIFGTLPFISTAFQFFDQKLFDTFKGFGQQDFEEMFAAMENHNKTEFEASFQSPWSPNKKRSRKKQKKRDKRRESVGGVGVEDIISSSNFPDLEDTIEPPQEEADAKKEVGKEEATKEEAKPVIAEKVEKVEKSAKGVPIPAPSPSPSPAPAPKSEVSTPKEEPKEENLNRSRSSKKKANRRKKASGKAEEIPMEDEADEAEAK